MVSTVLGTWFSSAIYPVKSFAPVWCGWKAGSLSLTPGSVHVYGDGMGCGWNALDSGNPGPVETPQVGNYQPAYLGAGLRLHPSKWNYKISLDNRSYTFSVDKVSVDPRDTKHVAELTSVTEVRSPLRFASVNHWCRSTEDMSCQLDLAFEFKLW